MQDSSSTSLYLYKNQSLEKILLRWWQSMMLSNIELDKYHIAPAPSGMKARLKRCQSVEAALFSDAFRTLWLNFPQDLTEHAEQKDLTRWAMIALVAVTVLPSKAVNLSNRDASFAHVAGSKKEKSDQSMISELRFAQLQSARTVNELTKRLRRIMTQLKGQVALVSLARDIEQWFIEQHSYRPRSIESRVAVRWAMGYYAAAGKS